MNSRKSNPVFAADSNLTEVEFFNRELNLEFADKPQFNKNGKLLIACTEPSKYEDILRSTPEKKIIFFLLGNETYSLDKFRFFSKFKSLNRVYFYNPPRENRQIGIISAFALIYDAPKSILDLKFYRTWKNAYDFARRSNNERYEFDWRPFPQGYSKRFVEELRFLNIVGEKGSLFTEIKLSDSLPKKGIGFVGQKGSWYRQLLISEFSKYAEFTFIESNGWGKTLDHKSTKYVETILNNRTTLHLPGNITNQTHRYMECFLLNRLPTSPKYTFQDHHLTEYWTEEFGNPQLLSYRKLSSYILAMQDSHYSSIVRRERIKLQRWVKEIRTDVEAFLINGY